MKTRTLVLMACMALPLTGCPAATTPPAALAPGYINAADQQMGEILAGARSFYQTIQQESAAGTVILTATEKTAFNAFGTSLNAANTVYLAYHSGTQTQAAAQAAVNTVQAQQAALPSLAVTQ